MAKRDRNKKANKPKKMKRKAYERQLANLEGELVKLQGWIKEKGLKVANIKRHARLNVISHLLSQIPYKDLTPVPIELPPRQPAGDYRQPDF